MSDLQERTLAPRPQAPARLVDPASPAGRAPPNDLTAEAAVLSAILLDRDALDRVLEILKPEHFYSPVNARIFQAAQNLAAANTQVDVITVWSWLRDRAWSPPSGGWSAYLAQLADATPAVGHAKDHAAVVVELCMVRTVIQTCQRVVAEGFGDVGDRREWMARASSAVNAATEVAGSSGATLVRGALRTVFDQVAHAAEQGAPRGIPTGWRDLDHLAGPLKAQLMLVGALSSVGKTSFARCLALSLGLIGVPVLFFSLEMDREEMAEAMLFTHARVDGSKVDRKDRLSAAEWERLTAAASVVSAMPIWIDDRTDLRPSDMRTRTLAVQAEARAMGYDDELVVMVDYVQIMNGRDDLPKSASREQEIGHIGRSLKNLSQALKVPVIALAQLNDAHEKRADKEPGLNDLRESRGLTQAANRIILLHNPAALARSKAYADGKREPAPNCEVMDVIVAKNRGGRTGRVRMEFFPYCTLFANHDGREGES